MEELNNIYSTSLKLFTILKEEYSDYLTEDKKKFLNNLDIFHFYKMINDKDLPIINYIGEYCYLNSYYKVDFQDYLPFICLSTLCGNLNPLKIGLIELELKELKEKYALKYNNLHEKETEVASILSQAFLNNIPYKIIFLDTDTEIVSYLIEEKGSKVGLLYAKTSKEMKEKRQDDYQEIIDSLYDYVSNKIR